LFNTYGSAILNDRSLQSQLTEIANNLDATQPVNLRRNAEASAQEHS
jgi:hypothetical protein